METASKHSKLSIANAPQERGRTGPVRLASKTCEASDRATIPAATKAVRAAEVQRQLAHSQKLASIGRLTAGIAHEINNPIAYVLSNLGTLGDHFERIVEMLSAFETLASASGEPRIAALAAVHEKIELDYLKEDVSTLISESLEGISRVRSIVRDLNAFSRADSHPSWVWANLHDGIDSTLRMIDGELRHRADVVREYADVPDVECLPTLLNQVFMNLLLNAAQAIAKPRGRIAIRTGAEGDRAWVEVADDGAGMPPGVKARIFEPFYTTKAVGQGTGLGLSLAQRIIHEHCGRIDVESVVGKGTTFRVWLPIRHEFAAAGSVLEPCQFSYLPRPQPTGSLINQSATVVPIGSAADRRNSFRHATRRRAR